MLILQAIILGLVQGLTEFIPISSSAHLIIVPWLFGWSDQALTSLTFDVALHLGTLLAVIAYFASDWVRLIRAGIASLVERKIGGDTDRKLAWLIVIGTIPGGIAGVFGESKIDQLFHQTGVPILPVAMIVMAAIIALLGSLLFFAEKYAIHTRGLKDIGLKDAILIGLAQALAIFPGVSRSGSTITAGLASGIERPAAARYSFLLSAPIIAGAGLKSLYDVIKGIHTIPSQELTLFPVGFVVAAVSGFLCIHFLLKYLQRNSTLVFVYYRWALAVLILVVALVRG
jgi:undecaprenyl-diphosphatase